MDNRSLISEMKFKNYYVRIFDKVALSLTPALFAACIINRSRRIQTMLSR